MSAKELEFPTWQAPLLNLLGEFDREKLTEQTQNVETLIWEHLQQLHQGGDEHIEHKAINDALFHLRIIKRDRLGFPDWK